MVAQRTSTSVLLDSSSSLPISFVLSSVDIFDGCNYLFLINWYNLLKRLKEVSLISNVELIIFLVLHFCVYFFFLLLRIMSFALVDQMIILIPVLLYGMF